MGFAAPFLNACLSSLWFRLSRERPLRDFDRLVGDRDRLRPRSSFLEFLTLSSLPFLGDTGLFRMWSSIFWERAVIPTEIPFSPSPLMGSVSGRGSVFPRMLDAIVGLEGVSSCKF